MDDVPRRPPVLRQRSDSVERALSPTDSVTSFGSSHGPLLVWMFKHIRRENQDSLTKEDLRKLLEVDIDNEQLDEAFENLDMDGDGRVSLNEFQSGFARFLREAPKPPGKERRPLLRAGSGLGEPSPQHAQRPRNSGKKRGSMRRRLVDEECYESADQAAGPGQVEVNGEPAVKPSEDFKQSLATLSSHNRHSIATLWSNLAETNPELLVDFEDFVGEVTHEVEGAQRALENQRKATKQEARELDEEMESRLNAANANLQIQTALTEVKTKLKLERRLGDKEKELAAVKQKLHELNSRLESVCNFALQLETEVQAGHRAHTELEEQFEVLSQEKADLQSRLEAREAVLMKKHEEMERLHQETTEKVDIHSIEDTQEELLEMKGEYEREICDLRETIRAYEINQCVTSDDDTSLLSGQTPDLLSTMSIRHRHTSRHSLLDEIIKQEGIESPMLRGEALMVETCSESVVGSRPWRANSLPNLFRTRQYLEPIVGSPIHFQASPAPGYMDPSPHQQQSPVLGENTGQTTPPEQQETNATGHVTSGEVVVATLDPPLTRSRSATVSGGGRPKLRPRRPKKSQPGHISTDSVQSHGVSRDSHVTASSDTVPSGESQETVVAASSSPLIAKDTEEGAERHPLKDDQYIMKCQVGPHARTHKFTREARVLLRRKLVTYFRKFWPSRAT